MKLAFVVLGSSRLRMKEAAGGMICFLCTRRVCIAPWEMTKCILLYLITSCPQDAAPGEWNWSVLSWRTPGELRQSHCQKCVTCLNEGCLTCTTWILNSRCKMRIQMVPFCHTCLERKPLFAYSVDLIQCSRHETQNLPFLPSCSELSQKLAWLFPSCLYSSSSAFLSLLPLVFPCWCCLVLLL